jgi:hypothetical protein
MTNTEKDTRRIEALLAAAYLDRAALGRRRDALLRSGIGKDNLPDQLTLMSFSLLGDHERDVLLAALREHWAALQAKGLVYGAMESELRPMSSWQCWR